MESTDNKVMGVLSYLGLLVLIPILVGPKTPFVRYHANQGLVLCLVQIGCSILTVVVGWIPFIGSLLGMILALVNICIVIFAIVGIVYVIQGKTKDLPVIGGIKILN